MQGCHRPANCQTSVSAKPSEGGMAVVQTETGCGVLPLVDFFIPELRVSSGKEGESYKDGGKVPGRRWWRR